MRELSKIESFYLTIVMVVSGKQFVQAEDLLIDIHKIMFSRIKQIYCDAMQLFLSRGAAYLINLGINSNEIAKI